MTVGAVNGTYGTYSTSEEHLKCKTCGSEYTTTRTSASSHTNETSLQEYNGDDGEISTGEKIGSFFKGMWNTITGAVKSIFTLKGFLKTALCIGVCFIPGIGPFIGAGLACIGIAKGAATVVKGAKQASHATTDAEARMAWENMGGGTFTAVASAVALKGAAGAIKANTASAGLATTKGMTVTQKLGTHIKGAKITYKNSGFSTKVTNTVGNLKTKGLTAYKTVRSGLGKKINSTSVGRTATKSYQLNRTFGNGRLASASSATKDAFTVIKTGVSKKATSFAKSVESASNSIKTNGLKTTVKNTYGNLRTKASKTYENIQTEGFTSYVKSRYNSGRVKTSGTTKGFSLGKGYAKVRTGVGTATKYSRSSLKAIRNNPYTLAGTTTLLDPEDATIRNNYYYL